MKWTRLGAALALAAGSGGCFISERETPSLLRSSDVNSTVCVPGELKACYSGPAGTAGVGTCTEGQTYCLPDGSGFRPCEGEVAPKEETCGDWLDEDCNGIPDDAPECLVNRGLVVRHLINEADSGQYPGQLEDAALDPVPLAIRYTPSLSFYVDEEGHRGLRWAQQGDPARADAPASTTKIGDLLQGGTALTVEIVARAAESTTPTDALVLAIGNLTITHRPYQKDIRIFDCIGCLDLLSPAATGKLSLLSAQRVAIHITVDLNRTGPEWLKVHQNGLPVTTAQFQPSSSTIMIPADGSYIIGNGHQNNGSFNGVIYYAAMYANALTEDEIQHNAQRLLLDDDSH